MAVRRPLLLSLFMNECNVFVFGRGKRNDRNKLKEGFSEFFYIQYINNVRSFRYMCECRMQFTIFIFRANGGDVMTSSTASRLGFSTLIII